MKNILLFILVLLSSCGSVESKFRKQEQDGTFCFNSPILEKKLDSLMTYVDILEDFDSTYCTIVLEPKDSIGLLTILISNGSVARLKKSISTFDKPKEILTFYGGVAIKTKDDSIVMIDSLSYEYLKAYIKNDAFSSSLYERCLTKFSHRIPYKWVFEINLANNTPLIIN